MEYYYINRSMIVIGGVIFLGFLYFLDELFFIEKFDKGKQKGIYFLDGSGKVIIVIIFFL